MDHGQMELKAGGGTVGLVQLVLNCQLFVSSVTSRKEGVSATGKGQLCSLGHSGRRRMSEYSGGG